MTEPASKVVFDNIVPINSWATWPFEREFDVKSNHSSLYPSAHRMM